MAQDLIEINSNAFQVHSFDLVSNNNELVTACDMAQMSLQTKSVDMVVFNLAIMGTNLTDFIQEKYRVLKYDGKVQIVEARSRIEYSHNSANNNTWGQQ